jgi:hypothetical protein
MVPFAANKGGMPLYTYVGNKILTHVQNRMLGSNLSEFHSGYRIYSVAALQKIPFRLNSNDFHFDTEIIIQLLNARQRVLELPIPTYYGDEICRVDGMKYAKDVLWATIQNGFHRAGLLYQRRFDPAVADPSHLELKLGFPSSDSYALDAVPQGAKVLDIGGRPDGLASELRAKGCDVAVTPAQPENAKLDVSKHQYLLLLDVIEHLPNPERFLEELRKQFDHDTKRLVLTTPNVAFVVQRLMLLLGQFNYGKAGILDKTHARLFTFRSARHLLRDAGFRIRELKGIPAPLPKVFGSGIIGRAAVAANLALIRLSPTLFSYQVYIEADSTPDVDFLVSDAKVKSAQRAAKLRKETQGVDLHRDEGQKKRARPRRKGASDA